MTPLVNDRWRGEFTVDEMGTYHYTVTAWMDRALTWHGEFKKRVAAQQVSGVDRAIGAQLIAATAHRAEGADRERLTLWSQELQQAETLEQLLPLCDDPELPLAAATLCQPRFRLHLRPGLADHGGSPSGRLQRVVRTVSSVPPVRGRASTGPSRTWKRGCPTSPRWDSTCSYLPPIHPVGTTFRKGKNNATVAASDDVGSPWGIGGQEGGHRAIHPQLGTIADFRQLVAGRPAARYRDCARRGLPMFARPSVCDGTSGLVPSPSGRDDSVCGESAEEIPGHLSLRF